MEAVLMALLCQVAHKGTHVVAECCITAHEELDACNNNLLLV
jgi:hypothetical protein